MKQKTFFLIIGGLAVLKLLSKNSSIGAIVQDKPNKGGSNCMDGKYSTFGESHKGGVCSYHGGREMIVKQNPTFLEKLMKKEVPRERPLKTGYYEEQEGNEWTANTYFNEKVKRLRAVLKSVFPNVLVRKINNDLVEISHKDFSALQEIGYFLFENCSSKSNYSKNKYLNIIPEIRGILLNGREIQTIVFCNEFI